MESCLWVFLVFLSKLNLIQGLVNRKIYKYSDCLEFEIFQNIRILKICLSIYLIILKNIYNVV